MRVDCPSTIVSGSQVGFIGESPGAEEVLQGKGFVGKSGQVLQKAALRGNLKWDECSLFNVVKERPVGNDISTISEEALGGYVEYLGVELTAAKLVIGFAVGETALHALTGKSGITKWRGSLLDSTLVPGLKVIPLVHPAWVLRGQFLYFWVTVFDISKGARELSVPTVDKWESITRPSLSKVLQCLEYVRVNGNKRWALDIETRGGSIACFSVAVDDYAICVPIQKTTGPYWTAVEETQVWGCLQCLSRENPNLVGQNLCFDLEWLMDYGVEPKRIYLDTMAVQSLLYPELPKSLAFLVSLYDSVPYYKDDGKTWGSRTPDADLWAYNNKDSRYTLRISYPMEVELREKNLWGMWEDYVRKELSCALEMQRTRLPIDEAKRLELKTIIEGELQSVQTLLGSQTGKELNVNSPKQIQEYLYETLGLPQKFHHKTRRLSADDTAVKELISSHPTHKAKLDLLLGARHLRKLLSSYINVELDPDGLLPGTWTVPGTETGRWSSGKSPRGRGANLQTLPKPIRYMVIPPEGRVFIQADLSQAEARVVAFLAKCQGLMDLFADGSRSVHGENARAIFGHDVEKDSPEYVTAKKCIHAAHYRMTSRKFALEAGLPLKRADEILEGYHQLYPEIRRWHEEVKHQVLTTGVLTTPFGRNRTFYTALGEVLLVGRISNDSWKDACSYLPQATVPDVTNHLMLAVWESCVCWLHHQGHDSFILSVPEGREGETCLLIREVETRQQALNPVVIHGRTLSIPVDISWGYNMFHMMKWSGEGSLPRDEWAEWVAGQSPISSHFKGDLGDD